MPESKDPYTDHSFHAASGNFYRIEDCHPERGRMPESKAPALITAFMPTQGISIEIY